MNLDTSKHVVGSKKSLKTIAEYRILCHKSKTASRCISVRCIDLGAQNFCSPEIQITKWIHTLVIKNSKQITTLRIFSSFISNEIPRPRELEPGLIIQIFINPSTMDSGLNFKMLSSVLLHCAYKLGVVILSSECGVCKIRNRVLVQSVPERVKVFRSVERNE